MKDLVIKALKPLYSTVITTRDIYEEDVLNNGIVVAFKGSLKPYQKVLSTGNLVDASIHVGDTVLINLDNFIQVKYKDGDMRNNIQEMETEKVLVVPFLEVNKVRYCKISDRDIIAVITDFDEVECNRNQNSLID